MAIDPQAMSLQGAVDLSGLVKKHQTPPAAQKQQGASALVRDVTEAEMSDIVTLSQQVPVILEFYGQGHSPALGPVVESFGGRLVLATIDVATSPELVRGLSITGIPTVFAIIQGRPAPLFQGTPPEDDIKKLFAEVLQVASQAGVTGVVGSEPGSDAAEDVPDVPGFIEVAARALAANDFEAANQAYDEGLASDPKNPEALAGKARVALLARIHQSGLSAEAIRQAAANSPTDTEAQFLVADVDMAGGHLDDAFARLLKLFAQAGDDDRVIIRQRLVDLFDAAGPTHPAVLSARQRLTSLLF